MIFYAIREKSTGYYLPQVKSNFTESEPTKDCIPRFHKDKATANRCLANWLKGRHHLKDDTHYTADGPEYDYYLDVEPDESRKKENMEVVELKFYRHRETWWEEM